MWKIVCTILYFILLPIVKCGSQTLVIAHRGASAVKTENSIAAFEEAIREGADYIETDVHQTSDSVVVIMHDFSVNRMCTISAGLKKKSGRKVLIREMAAQDFGSLVFKQTNENPPTLDSAIRYINGRSKLLIELKKGSDYYPGIEKRIMEVIRKNKAESWVNVIHSFDKKALLEINRQSTGMKLQRLIVFKLPLASFNFSKNLNKDKFENWQGVNVYYLFVTKRLVRRLHAQNKTVYAWTVNRSRAVRRMLRRGVDGIISNRPEMVKKEIIANK